MGVAQKRILFLAVAFIWIVLDQVSKARAERYSPGDLIGGPYLGIFQLRLVHNTGAAWGLFASGTIVLGVVSCIVCVAVLLLLFFFFKDAYPAVFFSAALLFAGGAGNAIDRFYRGYVVDFIEPVLIDFPVFNIADIGVTCGVLLLVVCAFFVPGSIEG